MANLLELKDKLKQYFNPESNQGRNFWSSPVAKGMANVQRAAPPVSSLAGPLGPSLARQKEWIRPEKEWFPKRKTKDPDFWTTDPQKIAKSDLFSTENLLHLGIGATISPTTTGLTPQAARNILKVKPSATTQEINTAWRTQIKSKAPRTLQETAKRYNTNVARMLNDSKKILIKEAESALSQAVVKVKPTESLKLTGKIGPITEADAGKIFKSKYNYSDPTFWKHIKSKGWSSDQILNTANRVEWIQKKAPGIIKNPEGFTYYMLRKMYPNAENLSVMGKTDLDFYELSQREKNLMETAARVTEVDMQEVTKIAEPEPIKVSTPTQDVSKEPKTETTRLLNKTEFDSLMNKQDQLNYAKNIQTTLYKFADDLGTKLNNENISIQDFEAGKTTTNTEVVEKAMSKISDKIKEVDPNWKPRKKYISHMLADMDAENVFGEIEGGIWIGSEDLKMGNIEQKRMGTMDPAQMEQDWPVVLRRYFDQVLNKLYLKNLRGETPLEDAVLDYTRDVKAEIIGKTGKARKIEIPDFVGEGNRSNVIDETSDYKLSPVEAMLRENNNIMKKIGGKFYEKWGNLRDVSAKLIDTKGMEGQQAFSVGLENSRIKKKALQDFVEQAGRTKITNGVTREYVNDQIANEVSIRQLERSAVDTVANSISAVFSRAHLWLSTTTGTKQLLETTRLGSYYNAGTIKKGVEEVAKNPAAEAKRLSDTYKLDEFDDAFDINKVKEEITVALKKDGNKGAVRTGIDIADKIGFSFLTVGERTKNILYASIAEQKGIDDGLTGEALYKEVRESIFEQGNLASKYNRAKLFDNSLLRLFFQYSQYGVKNTRQIVDAFQGKETQKAFGLIFSQLLNMGIIMGITGLSLKYALEQLLPLNAGLVVSFLSSLYEIFSDDSSEEYKEYRLKRLAQQNLQPGGAQTIRIKEGFKASKGYDESVAGRTRYYGEEASIPRTAQAVVFGKNALPDVRSYYKEDRGVLGENQSEIFNKLETREEKDRYAGQVFGERDKNKAVEEAKEEMSKGDEATIIDDTVVYEDINDGKFKSVNVDKYEETIAKMEIEHDREGSQIVGDRYIYWDGNEGKVKTQSVFAREKSVADKLYSLDADKLKAADDYEGWRETTMDHIGYLMDYIEKLDPVNDEAEVLSIEKKILDLVQSVEKYDDYGGAFKKGKAPKKITIKRTIIKKPKKSTFKITANTIKLPAVLGTKIKQRSIPVTKITGGEKKIKQYKIKSFKTPAKFTKLV